MVVGEFLVISKPSDIVEPFTIVTAIIWKIGTYLETRVMELVPTNPAQFGLDSLGSSGTVARPAWKLAEPFLNFSHNVL